MRQETTLLQGARWLTAAVLSVCAMAAHAQAYPAGPVTPGGKLWTYLDNYPNLWCDLSAGSALNAISRDPAVGRKFLLRYPDRCLFARDYFDGRLHEFIRACKLPDAVYRKIMSGNALRLVPA